MKKECAKRIPTALGASLYQKRLSVWKLVVEPPMTVDLSPISASATDADTCPGLFFFADRAD